MKTDFFFLPAWQLSLLILKKYTAPWPFLFMPIQAEPGSSVSIVSGYGLDDRAIGVRSPAEAKGFFL
jgi:hypothetical protein